MIGNVLYIFDDDKIRQDTRYKSFIDISKIDSSLIRFIYKSSTISKQEILNNACCVCFHDSMKIENDKNGKLLDFDALKRDLKLSTPPIPLVIFSNQGNQMTDLISDKELNMKSDDFYMNLLLFINDFLENHIINLKILALGKNYLLEMALDSRTKLLKYFNSFDEEEPLSLDIKEKSAFIQDLKDFEMITNKSGFANQNIVKLNSEQLFLSLFEKEINFIIKFL